MRRPLLATVLTAVLVALTACSSSQSPRYDATKTLVLPAPDLVKLKKQTDVPDCPTTPDGSAHDGLPAVTLSCLGGGRNVDVAGLRGPLILNFWASWCDSCREEMPALAAYAKSQGDVKVLGVDFLDPHPDAALKLAAKSDVAYPLITDPKGALDKAFPLPHVQAMPTTVFVSADGTIAHIEAKAYTSEQDVADAAQQYLGTGG